MAWKILNKRVVPYSQKDSTKLVFGDAVTISIELPTPHQEGDRYVLGIDWEAAPYPPSRPLCAGSQLFTVEGGILTFADVQTGTSRFREWICRQRKPAPVHVQIVRLRGSTAETLLLDDLLALPSVIDGEITVIEGDPLADLLDQKLDRPAVSGEAGDVLRMGDGLPVWGAWPQADWDEGDSTADGYIRNRPEIPSKVSDLENDLHFVTEADVSTTLEGYVTDAELSDAVSGKLDAPAESGGTGDVLRMGDGLPVWGAWPQADWAESDSTADTFIQNKPEIPSKVSQLENDLHFTTAESISETLAGYATDAELSDAVSGKMDAPTGGNAGDALIKTATGQAWQKWQQADWAESDSTADAFIQNKPEIPSKVSDLDNDLHFVTEADVSTTLEGYVEYDDLSDALSGYVQYDDLSDALSGKLDAPAGGEIGDVLTLTASGPAWQTVDTECYAYNLPIDTVADGAFAESDSASVSFAAWDPGDRRVAVIPFTGSALAFPEFSTSEAANRLRTVELWFKQRAGAGSISPIATPPGCHVAGSNFPSILEADSDSGTFTYHIFTARYMPTGGSTPYELAYQHSWPTSADIGGGPGAMCLALENRGGSAASISLDKSASMADRNIEYSLDGGWNWTAYSWTGATGDSVSVPAGGKVCWRGVNASLNEDTGSPFGPYYLHFTIPDGNQFAVYGSVTSLLDGNGESRNAGTAKYSLAGLFRGTLSLQDASGLLMPTTMGNENQCQFMFQECKSLMSAPAVLPSVAVAGYHYMFRDCTSLVNAPALPSTMLANYCYQSMFNGCTSLVNAPELPATELTTGCYAGMFNGCTSLVNAPELPATELTTGCYQNMFGGCTSLSSVKAHFTEWLSYATWNWLNNVSATGTFTCPGALDTETRGADTVPANWTVVNI